VWDALRLDVRHSFRSLRRAPTFSLIVIVTLAVAVGATTAVGSLLNALVFRKLAVPNPEQLAGLSAFDPRSNVSGYFYADTFNAYRSAQRSFAQMSMYSGGGLARVETGSGAFDALTETVSPTYFDIVGARPSAGRFFSDSDDAVVVISEGFRRRLFGDGPGVGETIKVDAVPTTVIGVAADGFQGLQSDGPSDIIEPFAPVRAAGGGPAGPAGLFRSRDVVGRLAPGVSIDAARAELLVRWPSIQSATLPATLPEPERQALLRQQLEMAPLASGFSGLRARYGTTLVVLLGLMAMLLAVACANLAGLALARSLTRRHQVAIRLALGGSVRRVFWQLLVDGLLLSAVAFAGAVPLAWGIIRAVTASLTVGLAKFPTVTPDARVLAATALLTLLIGLAMGVVSAWRSVAARVDECLRPGRGTIGSFGRLGRGLLVAQVAVSMTCLVGAGLFTATLARLRANDTSLQSQRIVFTRAYREPGDRQLLPPEYYETLVSDLAHMPGAEAAALSVYYPTYFGLKVAVPTDYHYTRADGVTPLDGTVLTEFVSPGFFDLFRLPLLKAVTSRGMTARGSPPSRCSRLPWLARCFRQEMPSAGTFGSAAPGIPTSK